MHYVKVFTRKPRQRVRATRKVSVALTFVTAHPFVHVPGVHYSSKLSVSDIVYNFQEREDARRRKICYWISI